MNPAIKLSNFLDKEQFDTAEALTALSMVYLVTCYKLGMGKEDIKRITDESTDSFFESMSPSNRGTLQ